MECRLIYLYLLILGCTLSVQKAIGQSLVFKTIGSDEGMRTLTSWHCAYDAHGHLWVSTSDGLLRYNGHEVSYFYQATHPGLPSDQTGYIFCDSKNQIWVCTAKGLARLDENRKMTREVVDAQQPDLGIQFCIEDGEGRMYALNRQGAFRQNALGDHWEPQPWLDSILAGYSIRDIRKFDKDAYLFTQPGVGAKLINMTTRRLLVAIPFRGLKHAARLDDQHIALAGNSSFGFYISSIQAHDSIRAVLPPSWLRSSDPKTAIEHMTPGANGKLYLATDGAGLIEFDPETEEYVSYTHEPANPFSIVDNALRYIVSDDKGNLAFTSLSGVSYTQLKPNAIRYFNYLKTEDGKLFDGRVIGMVEDRTGQIWVLMEDHVLIMNKERKTCRMLPSFSPDGAEGITDQPYTAALDLEGRIWIAFRQQGIGVFHPDGQCVRKLRVTDYEGIEQYVGYIRILRTHADGFMYVGSENGLFRMDQQHFTLDTFPEEPGMQPMRRRRVVDILRLEKEIWVSTSPNGAAWHYDFVTKSLKRFDTSNGLLSNRVYGLATDSFHNIYVGSYAGLNIIRPDGRIDSLYKGSGLPSTRIDAIERGKDGSIWLANTYNLLRYTPQQTEKVRLIRPSGTTIVNYQIMSSTVLASGEIAFGTHKGLVIVDPDTSFNTPTPVELFVFYQHTDGQEIQCHPDIPIRLSYNETLLRFSFAINDIVRAGQMVYRYKLSRKGEGEWSDPTHNPRTDFSLSPGEYTLEVEVNDGSHWYGLESPLIIQMSFPWWQRVWVVMLAILMVLGMISFYVLHRLRQYKNEMTISRQISDLESRALRAQMNPHFVFNSLNAIQECIVSGRIDEAYAYLSKFSKLLRLVLEHSTHGEVPLQEELEVLSLYISLEQLRFRDELTFDLRVGDGLEEDDIRIPNMMIQPYLENCIWHGLRHKQGEKRLLLDIQETIPGYLTIVVEDNGIGRTAALAGQENRIGIKKHKAMGKDISAGRIALLATTYPATQVTVTDLFDATQHPAGTRVQLIIPILKQTPTHLIK